MVGREKDKGQGIVELALVLPVLLLVVFGMIEMARLVQTYLAVQHAAREGARYAVVGLPSEDECATAYGHSCEARLTNGDVCPTEYSAFRTEAIKEKAQEAAIGLAWNPSETNASAPRYLGVWVEGQPSFYDEALMDCPGVPGARVRVRVFFNMPVITPILSGVLPTIQVSAETEMINEGFQTWVGAQAPPVLTVMPTLEPLDSDQDGLYDSEEFMGQCPYANNPDSDYDGINDGTEVAQGWNPCDPYDPYTPTPEIDPPTPTNTPTATPIPLQINEPLRTNDVVVTGVGDPNYLPVSLEVWDWTTNTRIGYGIVQSSRTFRIEVSPPLVAGHKIRVFGSYAWDEATVVGATNTPTNTPTATNTPTPTSTRTPTATPTPAPKITILSPTPPAGQIYSCTDAVGANLQLTVGGSGWPGDGATQVLFGWNGTGATAQAYTGNASVIPATNGTFTTSFTVTGSQVTEGKHNLYAFVVITGQQFQAPLYVPCSTVPTPTPTKTPTPTSTPTFTPTPVRKPDLVVTDMTIPGGPPYYAWTDIDIGATVKNNSTGPCNEFFWTDLYVYTDPVTPTLGEQGVQWKGISSLGANSSTALLFSLSHTFTISDTYYLYAQTDSFGFVGESDETNNVYGPVMLTVIWGSPTPTPTEAPTVTNPGSISGTVWAFIGGQLVVPSERVNMSLTKGEYLVQSGLSGTDGSYTFLNVSSDTGYAVTGRIEIDGIMYQGIVVGIQVLPGEDTSPVDIILYPL